MPLSSNYVLSPNLQQYFVDKVTGLPLAGGIVTFYKDQARNEKKDIYQLDGAAPNYTYKKLPNPITLSPIGTMVDEFGYNILPYFFPYNSAGDVELYYITVESADYQLQFSIQAFPNTVADTSGNELAIKNYIPNGQFYSHYITNEDPASPYTPAGTIRSSFTAVAAGGWGFWRSEGSTANDSVTFSDFGGAVSIPDGYPRYAANISCTSVDPSDQYKQFGIEFNDVNKFSSSDDSPIYYTLSFVGKSNSGSEDINVVVVKNYGAGGSSEDTIVIGSLTLTSSYDRYNIPFTFGNNSGKTIIGDGNLRIALQLPHLHGYDISVTGAVLTLGDVDVSKFPPQTNREFLSSSITPAYPDPTGMDLYCPLVLTKTGLAYDRSHVGRIYTYPRMNEQDHKALLLCDGSTYEADACSPIGIPYRRLRDYLAHNNAFGIYMPIFGTGVKQVVAYFESPEHSVFRLSGVSDKTSDTSNPDEQHYDQPNAQDGTFATTFTFENDATTYPNHVTTKITCKAGSLVPNGSWFSYNDADANMNVMWYRVDNNNNKPIVSGAYRYHVVDILSTDTLAGVTEKTVKAINYSYFAVPDYRGMFLRANDRGAGEDPDKDSRHGPIKGWGNFLPGAYPASRQDMQIQSHLHNIGPTQMQTYAGSGGETSSSTSGSRAQFFFGPNTANAGGNETRPKNVYVDYYIGY